MAAMDNPTNTSQRIRPILRAMERSIDEARRKRSGNAAPSPAGESSKPSNGNSSPALDRTITPAQPAPNKPASPMALHSATQAALQTIRPSNAMGSPSQPPHNGSAADPEQPVRLKARPKRWLPASA
jgi:hypothetical protein